MLPWDWRLDPRSQLRRLDAKITAALGDELSKAQGLDEVVLVAHSAGGLLVRAALNDPAIAKRVQRVLTIGTPYLGTPQALFPLLAGVYAPGSPANAAFIPGRAADPVQEPHTGNFILYPSANYGAWLSTAAEEDAWGRRCYRLHPPIWAARCKRSHGRLGFKTAISWLQAALSQLGCANSGSSPAPGSRRSDGIDVIAGWPIRQVSTTPAETERSPLLSANADNRAGAAKPLGDAVRISYLCGIDHIGLIQKR